MVYAPALSSSAFFAPAIYSLRNSNDDLAISTQRLSSGNRLSRIGDDVASFSVATRLQTQIAGLKQAAQNTAQANSLLDVASGGLTQIKDILDRMTSVATQANSGSLTSTDRSFLQQEFAELIEEIDRIADNTKFGGITLLDGSLSGENTVTTETDAATKATGTLTLTSNTTAGQTIIINGVTFTAGTDFTIGGDSTATIANLRTVLNSSTNTAISQATYTAGGNTLTVTHDTGGKLGNQFRLSSAGTASVTVGGASTNNASIYTLTGGLDDGLNTNSVLASGTIGDSLVNTQSQTKSSVTLYVTGTISNNETLRIDNGNGGYVDFTFKTTASTSTDIQIGADTAETLRNAIDTITQYSGSDDYVVRQLDVTRDGDNLIITGKNVGAINDLSGTVADIADTMTNGTLSAATITGTTTTGINTSGVTNSSFVGEVSGFAATYVGADSITATLTVGGSTYSASITDTTPASNTAVRFSSTNGGYFDVQLASGGVAVANQTNADTYASRLNAAFSSLTFYQNRYISDFTAAGSLAGATAKINLDNFASPKIDSITVTAPAGSGDDGVIEFTVDGEIFRSDSGIGGALGEYETFKFTSLEDSNRYITLTNGSTANSFATANAASTFQTALRTAFGLGSAGQGVDFQVGSTADDKINVVVGNASSSELFAGVTPDVSTQGNAEDALDTLETASNSLQTIMARVGAFQARLESAAANIDSSITGITAARSVLADTDIAQESTEFAQATLRINAGVAVLAQATRLQSTLLQALQSGS